MIRQVDQDSLNPHRWTRELVGTALRANQLGNARVKAYEVGLFWLLLEITYGALMSGVSC